MNIHDIELPEHWQAFQYNEVWGAWEQVIPSAADDPGVVKAYTEDQVRAAIEAERLRIVNCVKTEFHNALSKYKDSRNNYWDGAADAFCTAEQIVKGEN